MPLGCRIDIKNVIKLFSIKNASSRIFCVSSLHSRQNVSAMVKTVKKSLDFLTLSMSSRKRKLTAADFTNSSKLFFVFVCCGAGFSLPGGLCSHLLHKSFRKTKDENENHKQSRLGLYVGAGFSLPGGICSHHLHKYFPRPKMRMRIKSKVVFVC